MDRVAISDKVRQKKIKERVILEKPKKNWLKYRLQKLRLKSKKTRIWEDETAMADISWQHVQFERIWKKFANNGAETIETHELVWKNLCRMSEWAWKNLYDMSEWAWKNLCDMSEWAWKNLCGMSEWARKNLCDISEWAWKNLCNMSEWAWKTSPIWRSMSVLKAL